MFPYRKYSKPGINFKCSFTINKILSQFEHPLMNGKRNLAIKKKVYFLAKGPPEVGSFLKSHRWGDFQTKMM